MVLDFSVRRQTYVEDCEVCCNPIEISYTVEDDTLPASPPKFWNDLLKIVWNRKLVDVTGIEPATSSMPWMRSPS